MTDTPWKAIGCGIALFVVFVVALATSPFTIVNARHRGVVTKFGEVQKDILLEGFHWVSPIASVHEINVQTERFEANASAASSDLQTVTTQVVVNAHIDPVKVNILFQTIGEDYETKVVAPAIQDAVKASTAKYTAEELITKRAEVGADMQAILTARLAKNDIIVETVSIVDFAFSPSFSQAIEAKVTAEQDALASKNKLEQIKYEAEQRVVQAKAEAEAIAIQSAAIEKSGGDNYVQLQAIEKWDGKMPTYMLGGTTPFINLSK